MICDGTMVGFRKDLLEAFQIQPQESSSIITGSHHADRVLLRSPDARNLLLHFSGYTRDRKRLHTPQQLSASDLRQLICLLEGEELDALAQMVKRLVRENKTRLASEPYRAFRTEYSCVWNAPGQYIHNDYNTINNITLFSLQVVGRADVVHTIAAIASGDVDIFDSHNHRELLLLQQNAPVLAEFLAKCPTAAGGELPEDVRDLLRLLLKLAQAPFQGHPPPPDSYPPAVDDHLSFFPCLPQQHGNACYKADSKSSTSATTADRDGCRKSSHGHPTLSPGIFTIYCEHGVCYGFELLRSCESPKHPFGIFKTRFAHPPELIIYDNACRLHVYCLNREPHFFEKTRFAVDRFHWRGHIGCSSGYSLDSYGGRRTKSIHSQVNEQANAGLQKIRGQLAYMNIDNFKFHCSLFLALINMDKKLSVHNLHL